MTLVDVRESFEYTTGHAEGALNVPLTSLVIGRGIDQLDKNDEIILYCRSGHRAGVALQILQQHGFTHVTNGINQQHVELQT